MTRIDIQGEICRPQSSIFGEIPGTLATVKAQMAIGPGPYEVHVDSNGGSYEEALAIRSLLSEHECKVIVDAACYSAATLFLTLGEVTMRPGTLLMFHAPSASASGTAEDLGDAVTYLSTVRASAAALYASKSGKTIEETDALMARETWMTPEKAKEYGFCQIVDGAPVEAVAFVRSTAGMKLSADAPDSVRMIANPVLFLSELLGTTGDKITERVATLKSLETSSAEMRLMASETAAKLLSETEAHKTTKAELEASKDAVLRFEERVAKGVAKLAASARVAPVVVSTSKQLNDSEIFTQYKAITNPTARLSFYEKHKEVLIHRLANS